MKQLTKSEYLNEYRILKQSRCAILPKRRKTPWYILTKSEIKRLDKSRPKKTLGHAARLEAIVQAKLLKWEKRHPRPKKDLFEQQFMPEWQENRDRALQDIRDFVISVHYKLVLLGRYKIGEDKYTPYNIKIATVADRLHEFNSLWYPKFDSKSPLSRKVIRMTLKEKKSNPRLVAAELYSPALRMGKLVIPFNKNVA